MEEYQLRLKSKEDLVNLLYSLIKVQAFSMVVDENLLDLTARVTLQVSEMVSSEEVKAILDSK